MEEANLEDEEEDEEIGDEDIGEEGEFYGIHKLSQYFYLFSKMKKGSEEKNKISLTMKQN